MPHNIPESTFHTRIGIFFSVDSTSMPHFYSRTLQKASSINQAVYGNFSSAKAQEIVVSRYVVPRSFAHCILCRGKIIELLRPDEHGRLQSICSEEVFGLIRSIAVFRLVGAVRDYIILGSDSGRIVILDFDVKANSFHKVHQETFGKTGCRRIVPGEYLAVDPKGRACMIGAVEKQKFVYILNRDLNQQLTISSPLEAHKAKAILFSIVGLDVGFENPLFASIEALYDQKEDSGDTGASKMFTVYEMDLGINHVVRKYTEPVPESAHMLVPLTGGTDGPGGCLICCENQLIYKKLGRENLVCAYPRRIDCPMDRGVMIVSYAKHKLKDFTLVLLQTEFGDLLRVDLVRAERTGVVEEVRVSYFDSIPRSVSICVLKTGFLFAAAEAGNHALYQFQASAMLSAALPTEGIVSCSSANGSSEMCVFRPKQLTSLSLFDELSSLCPLTDMTVMDPLTEQSSGGACQVFALCGRGARSSLKAMKYGVGVTEMALTELPGKPSGVWTLSGPDGMDRYIVISFMDASLVLAIGETVQEVSDSGLLTSVQTMAVGSMFDGSVLQVHSRGIRHIHEQTGRVSEWRVPGGKQVAVATCNTRQAVVGLTGGEIVYFELENGVVQEIAKREMGSDITSLAVAAVPEGRLRALVVAVSGSDRSVRILSLEPDKILKQLSAQSYQTAAESTGITDGFLNIGLGNGTLVRCCLDRVTGVLSDPRSRFLGIRPVRLQKVKVEQRDAILALSSRPWLVDPVSVGTVPLSYSQESGGVEMPVVLEFAASFNSEQCPDGLVTIAQNTLRIIALDRPGASSFAQQSVPLSYTPRKLIVLPPAPSVKPTSGRESLFIGQRTMLAILEADHNSYSEQARNELAAELSAIHLLNAGEGEDDLSLIGASGSAGEGKWGSCVRIVDPVGLKTQFRLEMDKDEAAVAMGVVYFYQLKDNRPCFVVASAERLQLRPHRWAAKSVLKTYLYDDQFTPQLVHVTPVTEGFDEGVPLAMCQYEGRLLVSISGQHTSLLRLYELGKKRLLKKTEYRNTACGGFVSLQVVNDRIFAADVFNSIHVLKLNKTDGQLYVVCDDIGQRYMTSMLALDYNSVLGGDKFDNLFLSRVPVEVREQQAGTGESTMGSGGMRLGPDTAYILGKTHKLEPVANFHLGETITSLQKVTMSTGASEVVMWSTLSGAVGVLYPFLSKKEYELFLGLEMHMTNAAGTSLVGRDHRSFRSYYLPVKGVVDGDLIAGFSKCHNKTDIAKLVGKSVNEIEKIIEEIHNRIT